MDVGSALLLSAVVTGRVTVVLVFALAAIGASAHVIAGAVRAPRPVEQERGALVPAILSFALLVFAPLCVWRRWGSLEFALPLGLAAFLAAVGTVLCFSSLSFVGWAGRTLGRSAHPTARVDRGARLVRSGPFAMVRNPIYFALGLLLAGAALAGLSWPVALAAILWWPVTVWRVRFEEQVLRRAYGPEYEEYVRAVPPLWPRFGSGRAVGRPAPGRE